MRPNCLCGHGYEKHGWGTTGCEVCTDHCYAYRQSFCGCGHVWESHGVVDGKPDELACPFCGITCKHWRTIMSETKSPENGQTQQDKQPEVWEKAVEDAVVKPKKKVCVCGHTETQHYAKGTICSGCVKDTRIPMKDCCREFEEKLDTKLCIC